MNEVTTRENTEVALSAEAQFLAVIERMASNPDVDVAKLGAILDMQERIIAKRAESEFNTAFAEMQPSLPRIKKSRDVVIKEVKQYSYAEWDKIDEAIRPILNQHGFSLSFNTAPRTGEGGGITVIGTLRHVGGHKITAEIPLALENSGSKNNVQGMGSTFSYGKRYTTTMLLNLTIVSDDDDGKAAGTAYITAAQVAELQTLLDKIGDTTGFLRFAGVDSVAEIETKNYMGALNALQKKAKAVEGGK